jgi:glycosyltransferase involved in cell wall biosynthesis
VDEGKGWALVANSVAALRKKKFDVRFLVAGSGAQAREAETWCNRHSEFASFMGFVKNPEEDVFPTIDVLVLASRREGLPMSILEALSHGIPVLATPVGGIPQAIDPGTSGYLIERSEASITHFLEEIIGNTSQLAMLSRGARQKYLEHFSHDAMGTAYSIIYKAN